MLAIMTSFEQLLILQVLHAVLRDISRPRAASVSADRLPLQLATLGGVMDEVDLSSENVRDPYRPYRSLAVTEWGPKVSAGL